MYVSSFDFDFDFEKKAKWCVVCSFVLKTSCDRKKTGGAVVVVYFSFVCYACREKRGEREREIETERRAV